jgi:hypothetical protein
VTSQIRPQRLGRAAAANLRALLPQGGIGERLEGLVQGPELVRDAKERLRVIGAPVELVHLVAQAVEAFEQRVELAVTERPAFHES